jgi:hypothetical protein
MKRFGRKPDESDDFVQVETPVGVPCLWCDEPIVEGDIGVIIPHLGSPGVTEHPYHLECNVRMIIGGLNHLKGLCSCFGGTEPNDPPDMSLREAANAAVDYLMEHPLQ